MEKQELMNEIIERGRKYVIPERFNEWREICLKNCDSEAGCKAIKDIFGMISAITVAKQPLQYVARSFDRQIYNDYEWDWIEKQIVRFSPKGYHFVMSIHRERSSRFIEELENLRNENKSFESQRSSGVRV